MKKFLMPLLLMFLACYSDMEEPIDLGITVSSIGEDCSGGGNPLNLIDRLVIKLASQGQRVVSKSFRPSDCAQGTCVIKNIPVNLSYIVTLLGYESGKGEGDVPSWFGRRRHVPISQDKTTTLDIVMTRFGQVNCLKPPTSFVHTMFPSVTRLGDGRILVAGGFTEAYEDPITPGVIELKKPTDLAFIYDPMTGVITQTNNPMSVGRAGHTAVFVPTQGGAKVVLFGGTNRMKMDLTQGKFPFSISTEDSLKTYDVFDVTTNSFLPPTKDELLVKRAFASSALLTKNFILVFGGGQWPKASSAEYMKADIWSPLENQGAGGIQKLGNAAPVMNSAHNTAAIAKVDTTSTGLERYIIGGGNTGKEMVFELYTSSSNQQEGVGGVFKVLSIQKGPKPPNLFFPTLTPLSGKRFLLAGGVPFDGNNFSSPLSKAWLISVVETTADIYLEVTELNTAGCNLARFFHSATPFPDLDQVAIIGGFSSFTSGQAISDVCFFDLNTLKFSPPPQPFASPSPRAGHSAEVLLDDTIILVGGIKDKTTMMKEEEGMFSIYTPPTINLNADEQSLK